MKIENVFNWSDRLKLNNYCKYIATACRKTATQISLFQFFKTFVYVFFLSSLSSCGLCWLNEIYCNVHKIWFCDFSFFKIESNLSFLELSLILNELNQFLNMIEMNISWAVCSFFFFVFMDYNFYSDQMMKNIVATYELLRSMLTIENIRSNWIKNQTNFTWKCNYV